MRPGKTQNINKKKKSIWNYELNNHSTPQSDERAGHV
jgi:hypothetical protein